MGRIGSAELVIILLVALLVFGKRLPDVARQAGRAISEFRRSFSNIDIDDESNQTSDYELNHELNIKNDNENDSQASKS